RSRACGLSGAVDLCNGYCDFALFMSFFKVPESLRDFIQPVTLGDDRSNLSSRHEFTQDGQILLGYSRNKLSIHAVGLTSGGSNPQRAQRWRALSRSSGVICSHRSAMRRRTLERILEP